MTLTAPQARRRLRDAGAKLRRLEAEVEVTRTEIADLVLAARAADVAPAEIAGELDWSQQNVFRVRDKRLKELAAVQPAG